MVYETLTFWSSLTLLFILNGFVFWRWKLKLRLAVLPAACAAISSYFFIRFAISQGLHFDALTMLLSPVIATLFWSGIMILALFFRDPERHFSDTPGSILSPADGTVIYVRPVENGHIPIATKKNHPIELRELLHPKNPIPKGILIGIEMLLTDVHVNRAPIAGRVVHQEYIRGQFRSLRDPESRGENERLYTVFQNTGIKVGVIQIASRRVRRILSFIQPEDVIKQGERIGMIQFGSQVDLLIDEDAASHILISEGEHVRAGETIIARYSAKI